MIITPGYDFTVNEVPTHLKLQTMLGGMSLAGISPNDVESGLIGEKFGNSNASTPTIGWLRSDPSNFLWLRTPNGEVPVFRANWGGWESKRFRQGSHSSWSGIYLPEHARGFMNNESVGGSLESLYTFRADSGAGANPEFLKVLDSGISGSPLRFVGRGGSIIGFILGVAQFNGNPAAMRAAADADGTNYTCRGQPVTALADLPFEGSALMPLSSRRRLAWFYGTALTEQ